MAILKCNGVFWIFWNATEPEKLASGEESNRVVYFGSALFEFLSIARMSRIRESPHAKAALYVLRKYLY